MGLNGLGFDHEPNSRTTQMHTFIHNLVVFLIPRRNKMVIIVLNSEATRSLLGITSWMIKECPLVGLLLLLQSNNPLTS